MPQMTRSSVACWLSKVTRVEAHSRARAPTHTHARAHTHTHTCTHARTHALARAHAHTHTRPYYKIGFGERLRQPATFRRSI